MLIAGTCFADWQQVYKVIPDTTTWQYEWRYRGQVGVGNDTTTVNAFMRYDGLIQGTTIYATDHFKCPDGTVFTSTSTFGGGGGSSTFLGLTDTPAAFDSGKYFKSWTSSGTWETPAGGGDMLKATYDANTNDVVDNSEALNGYAYTHFLDTATAESTYITETDSGVVTFSNLEANGGVGEGNTQVAYGTHTHTGVYEPADSQIMKEGEDISLLTNDSGYIVETDSGVVTFENLEANGDVGSGDSQVAYGTHTHTGVYEPADATIMKEGENVSLLTNDSGYLTDLSTGVTTQAYDADLDDLADGTLSASKIEDKFLRNDADDSSNYKLTLSSLAVTNQATVGSLSSSGQVTSNSRKVIDTIELDAFYIVGSTTAAGTTAVKISAYRDYAITITTMTVKAFGGTNCIGMIEQRARSADGSAGTDIWSGDITILTTGYIGGTVADFTVPANYALWFKPTSWTGAVTALSFDGAGTKD